MNLLLQGSKAVQSWLCVAHVRLPSGSEECFKCLRGRIEKTDTFVQFLVLNFSYTLEMSRHFHYSRQRTIEWHH